MHNLVFCNLSLEFQEFYFETLWICTHCKLNRIDILALKNGKRIFLINLSGLGGDLELGLMFAGLR
jgi:hypothetical protein